MINFTKKISIIGEGAVGKTTFMNKYIHGKFSKTTEMIVGAEFFTKIVETDEVNGKLTIWDLGGQDRFRPLMRSYLEGSEGIFLMYDLNRLITLIKIQDWIKLLKLSNIDTDGKIPIILIGSKKDLYDFDHDDRDEYIEEITENCSILKHFEISSLTNENVNECFETMVSHIIKDVINNNK